MILCPEPEQPDQVNGWQWDETRGEEGLGDVE